MKSTKKKYKGRGGVAEEDSDEEAGGAAIKGRGFELAFLTEQEIEEELQKMESLSECPHDFLAEMAQQLHR